MITRRGITKILDANWATALRQLVRRSTVRGRDYRPYCRHECNPDRLIVDRFVQSSFFPLLWSIFYDPPVCLVISSACAWMSCKLFYYPGRIVSFVVGGTVWCEFKFELVKVVIVMNERLFVNLFKNTCGLWYLILCGIAFINKDGENILFARAEITHENRCLLPS